MLGGGAAELAENFAHPKWLVERWIEHYGIENAEAVGRYDQTVPVTAVRIAGNEVLGLVHHVELPVAFDLADEHGLGDVMVRQHLRRAAGQVRHFGAG